MKKIFAIAFFVLILATSAATAAETPWSAGAIGEIFIQIFSVYWKDTLLFSAGFLLKTFLAWLVSSIIGVTSAVFIWNVIRKRGLLDAPWRYYHYCRWLWFPMIVVPCALAIGLATGWIYTGFVARHAITHDRIIARTMAALYCTIEQHTSQSEPNEIKTSDDLINALESGEELLNVTLAEIGDIAKDSLTRDFKEDGGLSTRDRLMLWAIPDRELTEKLFGNLRDRDARIVLAVLAAVAANTEFGQQYIDANSNRVLIAAALSESLKMIENEYASAIASFVRINALIALSILGIPTLLLWTFRGVVRRIT